MVVKIPQIQKHLENIERELAKLRELLEKTLSEGRSIEISKPEHIEKLKKELKQEEFDKDLVQLVGTVPLRQKDYKEDIRKAVSAKHQTSKATS